MSSPLNKKLPDWRRNSGRRGSDGNVTKGRQTETSKPEQPS
jgi:hypothetical protein